MSHRASRYVSSFCAGAALFAMVAACGDSASSDGGSTSTGDDGGTASDDGGATTGDGAASTADAAPASRNASCTPLSQQNGTAVSTSYGRLDGTLVYVVGIGQSRSCNGDDSHVHLQVEVSGNVYDVAVDIGTNNDEVGLEETSITVPGGAWSEGWHGSDSLAYKTVGVHSSDMPLTSPHTLGTNLENLLVSTSQISIFCTGYTTNNGCHDVHYVDGTGRDGAIVLDPSSASSPVIFFRFSSQSF